jgi:hypothetical protein
LLIKRKKDNNKLRREVIICRDKNQDKGKLSLHRKVGDEMFELKKQKQANSRFISEADFAFSKTTLIRDRSGKCDYEP